MPNKDFNKEQDLLRELEIQSILEETHYLADQEKMEKVAEKYRAKPKMDDIFSNANKKPRLTNESPLEVDKTVTENAIVGEKTATTIQASMVLDGNNEEEVKTPEQAIEEENEFVTLTPEYDEGTCISGEVLGEVDQFKENSSHIESINTIDIDMNSEPTEQEEPKEEKSKYEELFGIKNGVEGQPAKKVVSKVPVYKQENPRHILNVKAGKFSDVVAFEYEEYIRSKNPSVIAHVIRPEPKIEEPEIEEKEEDTRSTQEKILSAVVGFFSKDESDDNDIPQEKAKTVEDYTGEDDEEKSIMYELNLNLKRLFTRSLISGIIATLSIVVTVITRVFPDAICSAIPFAPAAYATLNFILVGFSLFVNKVAMTSGLTPLMKFKGNSDTAVAVGGIAAILQTITSFFCLGDVTSFNVNYYCVIVLLAFFANNLGKLFMVLRVKDNFRFITSKSQKYAAKIYTNEDVANKMLSGTASDKTIIAYQHKTNFASNFLKISYAPDPSEDLASKIAPLTTVAALLITLLYGIAKGTFTGAINAFALVTAVAIPVSTLLAVNLPVRKLCKTLLNYGAMLAGYPSIKQFCDSTAVMIDANELFPADSIELEGIKTFEDYNVDESLLCGIAILKEAQNPIANAFDSVVAETKEKLPDVESVLYEDEMGLVGWINSERILVGSRQLMEKYSVETPNPEYEDKYKSKGRQITYLARAGRLVAMFVTRYHADKELMAEMQRAEANGISFLIRTTDYNINNDLIASLYNLFYRSIKVLPTGLGNVLKEAQGIQEESSRSYLITHGKASSLSRAVSGSVRIKHNISLAIVIQLIAIILGMLVASTLALYAGVGVMGTLEVLMYAMFWGVAAIIAPSLQKP